MGPRVNGGKKRFPVRRGPPAAAAAAALFVVFFCLLWSSTSGGDGLCDGCLNGGRLLMPNNIFGYCRCKCLGDFRGPKCQFLYKRSSPPLLLLSPSSLPARYLPAPGVVSSNLAVSERRQMPEKPSPPQHRSSSGARPGDRVIDRKLKELKAFVDRLTRISDNDSQESKNSQ